MGLMPDIYDEAQRYRGCERCKELEAENAKLKAENEKLRAEIERLKAEPRPNNADIYTCICGWHGTLDEMDALGSEAGCCPCGNENLPTITELQAQLKAKDRNYDIAITIIRYYGLEEKFERALKGEEVDNGYSGD
jgi:hypothetical protein